MGDWRIDDETGAIPGGEVTQTVDAESNEALLSSMREVNKLIFVQDFAEAERRLRELSLAHPYEYEVQFRLIEVSYKTGDLAGLVRELETRARTQPDSVALQLGWTLGEIRLLEQRSSEQNESVELLNPSLSSGLRDAADVFGLSARSEMAASGGPSHRMLPPHWGTSAQARGFRVTRNPLVADDAVPADLPPIPEVWADRTAAPEETQWLTLPLCVRRARQFTLEYPENYAAWFVAGCALEFGGKLGDAVGAWTKAATLQPNSISVLATMAELQQMGVIPAGESDYSQLFETIDRYLVHGSLETHVHLFREYLGKKEYDHAVAALRTLADWMQRQRGEVPSEIETLCLLGAMKAYEAAGNHGAANACRVEAENLVVATRSAPRSAAQLKFLGEICQQFGMDGFARQCYVSAVQMPDSTVEAIVQMTSHVVAIGCPESFREALKVAYTLNQGASEVRFCQTLCSVALAGISVRAYMDRKNHVRDLLQSGDLAASYPLILESLQQIDDDPEIHYYAAEILARVGAEDQAAAHFQKMRELDPYNIDSLVRYCYFLLKRGEYEKAREVSEAGLRIEWIGEHHFSEFHWAHATASYALGFNDVAERDVEASMRNNPWNGAYLTLALRLQRPAAESLLPVYESLPRELEDGFMAPPGTLDVAKVMSWLEYGQQVLTAGYASYAYLLSRCLYLLAPEDAQVVEFFARAGAGFNSRITVQHLLLLLQSKPELKIPLGNLACQVARVYAYDHEWELCREWCDIASKSGLEDRFLQARLVTVEALGLVRQGRDLRRAQSLLEAAHDIYEVEKLSSLDVTLLLAYVYAAQGDRKRGLERIASLQSHDLGLLHLYYAIKTLERCQGYEKQIRELVAMAFQKQPCTTLERKLLEEIFCVYGKVQAGLSVPLAC